MSADEKTVAVGTALAGSVVKKNGYVSVFMYHNDSSWKQVSSNITDNDLPVNEIDKLLFANVVALSADGTTVAVGAPFSGSGYEGRLLVYKFEPTAIINTTCNLYNSMSNTFVATLLNGTVITSPPPCNQTNVEAMIPCEPKNGTVVSMELYLASKTVARTLVHSRRERLVVKYFLFGNNRTDVYSGRIPSGTYMIRAWVEGGLPSPFTTFTLGGKCT